MGSDDSAAGDGREMDADPTPEMDAERRWPDHERLERLGRGVHATVYRVQLADGDIAALRLPHLHAAGSIAPPGMDTSRAEFPEGMTCWAAVSDLEGVATLREMGLEPRPWALVEYCECSLQSRGDDLAPAGAAALVVDLAETVRQVHTRGIVHRDIKRSNVLLTADEELRLGDWGEAEGVDSANGADAKLTDIRAVGLLAYELLTGLEPYDRTSGHDIATFFESRSIMPPGDVDPSLPEGIDDPVLDAFAHPERTTVETLDRLESALRETFELR